MLKIYFPNKKDQIKYFQKNKELKWTKNNKTKNKLNQQIKWLNHWLIYVFVYVSITNVNRLLFFGWWLIAGYVPSNTTNLLHDYYEKHVKPYLKRERKIMFVYNYHRLNK